MTHKLAETKELVTESNFETGTLYRGMIQKLPGREPFMLDRAVAAVYGVETRRLMVQVNRNRGRFTDEMVFRLSETEVDAMISQNGISRKQLGRGGTLHGFTQLGANMAAFYLKSGHAAERALQILKAFVHFEEAHRRGQLMADERSLRQAQSEGMRRGLALSQAAAVLEIDVQTVAQIVKFRVLGLTQAQAGGAFGMSKHQVARLEAILRPAGIGVKPIKANQARAHALSELDALLSGDTLLVETAGGAL